MTLPDALVNFYDTEVVRDYMTVLTGDQLIFRGKDLPKGKGLITRNKVSNMTGTAKRGYRLRTIPRETGEVNPYQMKVIEHAYGFTMHRKELEAYESEGISALNVEDASQAARIVANSVDDVIFNGDTAGAVKGIYSDASNFYSVTAGQEWNKTTRNPLDDIINALEQFEASGLYVAKKLALNPVPYRLAFKKPTNGQTAFIQDIADLFGGMENIVRSNKLPIGGGLICAFDKQVAERNVEEEINIIDFDLQPDSMYPFNVETYQATDVKKLDGFLQLRNLYA